MAEPVWIEEQAIIVLHVRSIALHGGPPGVGDRGLLSSALDRARSRYSYEGVEDIGELAATYAAAVSANRPFADGNKRAAFHCLALFLRLNGLRLTASQADAALTILDLAAGRLDIASLADWVRRNSGPA